ncbi:hypothetical protein [Geodermatophilus sp. SYSU D00079]
MTDRCEHCLRTFGPDRPPSPLAEYCQPCHVRLYRQFFGGVPTVRLGPDEDDRDGYAPAFPLTATDDQPVLAWRWWYLGTETPNRGVLSSPYPRGKPAGWWTSGSLRGLCDWPSEYRPHPYTFDAPAEDCSCGVRGFAHLDTLLAYDPMYLATVPHAVLGVVELTGRILGPGVTPSAIPPYVLRQGYGWTRTVACRPPRGTLRAATGRVGRHLWVGPAMREHVTALRTWHPWVTVHELPDEADPAAMSAAVADLPGLWL